MAKGKSKGLKEHEFRDKLLLNQWLISLFGINPWLSTGQQDEQPFQLLAKPISAFGLEGLDHDNLHRFYHELVSSDLFAADSCILTREQLHQYEENIVRHTLAINEKRHRLVEWKYFQWLTLLFVEIYLDRYFGSRDKLLDDLNKFVDQFNRHSQDYVDIPPFEEDNLNKLCLQNATGSGKTLLMHVNLLQYRHYAKKHGKEKDLSRVILLTTNESLTDQHLTEFQESCIPAGRYLQSCGSLFDATQGLGQVDVLEVTKLADQEGPNTIATRSLGDQNLLLVDEGHRGMSSKEEGVWFKRRSMLCAKGFTFEYSATFEQAAQSSGDMKIVDSYSKAVIFDYSYRWFYEDGFGKDYQILNLPQTFEETRYAYMTACLLKFYQQLRIYQERPDDFGPFNIEKPLWVFVGNTVSGKNSTNDEQQTTTDLALIIRFVADFLADSASATQRIDQILTGGGVNTGLLDQDGNDIFAESFRYLTKAMIGGQTHDDIYQDILAKLFNHAEGRRLTLDRIKGESGEVALYAGKSETPFGLINVGDASGLCDLMVQEAKSKKINLSVKSSDFSEAMFASVKDSSSSINLLIGSKKFIEGWDCWRVSTMGLMHVGRSEGTQIIQLFGRGVRLKGYEWSLKRSGHTPRVTNKPEFIEELETLNVFGIKADFMEKFREYLRAEGLPGNERRKVFTIPMHVTRDFGKKLKTLRPKLKASDGKEYDFKQDGPVPTLCADKIPEYLKKAGNKVVADWYPRIQAMQSLSGSAEAVKREVVTLEEEHLALLDYDAIYLELEQFKRERGWYNFNITIKSIKELLKINSWYTLYIPKAHLNPTSFDGVLLLEQVATELLKRYCNAYYNYRKREYIEPRLEVRELAPDDYNLPQADEYQLIVDGDADQVILAIQQLKDELGKKKDDLISRGTLTALNFKNHLFQPLLRVRRSGKITIAPAALNDSEFQFVTDLKKWCDDHESEMKEEGLEIFLLRNQSSSKGLGFFEAGGFHPDFIMWMFHGGKQLVTFIEPHGLVHEGPGSKKVKFDKQVKNIEQRLNDPEVILNSFILSWTHFSDLDWNLTQQQLENMHILFMEDDKLHYIDKLIGKLKEEIISLHKET